MMQRPQQQPPYTPMRQGPINPPSAAKRPADTRPPPPQQKRWERFVLWQNKKHNSTFYGVFKNCSALKKYVHAATD